jgi:hypothetical protein
MNKKKKLKKLVYLILTVSLSLTGFIPIKPIYANSWTFNNTSTGRSGTIQSWTVPESGEYRITAYGAGFNNVSNQKGAKISGVFALTKDQTLDILVGQMGSNAYSGSGGTFVVEENNILVVAGGAGGQSSGDDPGIAGQITTSGAAASDGTAGGTDGGGGTSPSGPCFAQSGAGYSGDGNGCDTTVAQRFLSGGVGAAGGNGSEGGFGGGGTGRTSDRIGGGGGYSGGGARGDGTGWGGGGGSYNNGTNQDNEAGVRTGHGLVEIETTNSPPSAPTSLQVNGASNPDISDHSPVFSAVYNDDDTGDVANKYQIQVDDNTDFSSPIWDSGSAGTSMSNCSEGSRCEDITYGGTDFADQTTYYWRIKFWDEAGAEGSWSASSAWYNSSWSKRRPITVDNSSNSSSLTDYQVQVTVSYDSDMNSDFSDLRFTDSDGTTELDYWIEDYTSETSATVWVEVPSISASSTKDIYIYYGNSSASSASNGENTFTAFDNFDDNTMNQEWSIEDADQDSGTSFTETNQQIQIDAGGADTWQSYDRYGSVYQSISGDFIAQVKIISQENTNQWAKAGIMIRNSISNPTTSTGYTFMVVTPGNGWSFQYDSDDDGYLDTSVKDGTSSYPTYIKMIKSNTTFTGYFSTDGENWTQRSQATLSSANNTQDVGMSVTSHEQGILSLVKFDDFRIRKYTDPEPSTSVGAEEIEGTSEIPHFYVMLGCITSSGTITKECTWNNSLGTDSETGRTIRGVHELTGTDNTGTISIASGVTVTVGAEDLIVVGEIDLSGDSGSIAIVDGGIIKPGGTMYYTDEDNDGYAPNENIVLSKTGEDLIHNTEVLGYNDPDDYNDCITGDANHLCGNGDLDGTCSPLSAGEHGLAACQRCNGTSVDPVNISDNTQDTEGSNICNGLCQACQSGSCGNATAETDPGDDCEGDWTGCQSTCVREGSGGNCDGSGACMTSGTTENVASGYVCTGNGDLTQVSETNYCNQGNNCSDGDCSASKWYTSCDGSGSCRAGGDSTDAYTVDVYADSGNSLTADCSTTGTTNCGYGSWSCSSDCQRQRDQYFCNGSGSCNVDDGLDYSYISSGYICSGGSETSDTCGTSSYTCDGDCRRKQYEYACNGSGDCNNSVNTLYSNCSSDTICSGGSCVSGTCGTGPWSCDGDCRRKRYGYACNGSNSCSNNMGYVYYDISSGKICSGGDEVSGTCGTSSYYCDGYCRRYLYEYACNGSGSCSNSVNTLYTNCPSDTVCSGGSCGYSGSCDTGSISSCDGACNVLVENLRCNGSNSCSYVSGTVSQTTYEYSGYTVRTCENGQIYHKECSNDRYCLYGGDYTTAYGCDDSGNCNNDYTGYDSTLCNAGCNSDYGFCYHETTCTETAGCETNACWNTEYPTWGSCEEYDYSGDGDVDVGDILIWINDCCISLGGCCVEDADCDSGEYCDMCDNGANFGYCK